MEKVLNKKRDTVESILFLLAGISGIVFVISLLWWNTNSDYYSESIIPFLIIFGSLAISIALFIVWYIKSSNSLKISNTNWLNMVIEENNINHDDVKCILKNTSLDINNKELLYTRDRRLFYLDIGCHKIYEIKLCNILKLDLECTTMEKNTKRIIALTTTYDNIKSISSVKIKVITEDNIYSMELDKTREVIDKATQFKLIIDREVEKINN